MSFVTLRRLREVANGWSEWKKYSIFMQFRESKNSIEGGGGYIALLD